MRHFFVVIMLVLLVGCARPGGSMPVAAAPSPTSEGHALLSAGAVRAERATRLGTVVTVVGVVTSRQPDGLTIQSGGGALFLPGAEGALGQELLVTGRVAEVEGQLALTDLEEIAVERESVPLPAPVPLTFDETQESLYVEAGPSRVAEGSRLLLADGRLIPLQPPDASGAALAPGTSLDGATGVLRRDGTGWRLVPPLPRDIRPAPPILRPCDIQGDSRQSPYRGRTVETEGIVTQFVPLAETPGFFLQEPACDGDPATSDALFVALAPDGITPGDRLRLRGRVEEHYGRTGLADVGPWRIEGSSDSLPTPEPIAPPPEAWDARDYLEAFEGMRVLVAGARVVAPTNRFGEFSIVAGDVALNGNHLLRLGGPLGAKLGVAMAEPERAAQAAVGQRAGDLVGVLDFTFGQFKLLLDAPPALTGAPPPTPTAILLPDGAWSAATINAENLFDSEDDPAIGDDVPSDEEVAARLAKLAAVISGPLGMPTIVALQEVENQPLLRRLAAEPALEGRYEAIVLPSHDPRGITQGFLVERGRVELVEAAQGDPCSSLAVPGAGPAEGCPEGERRLFTRAPLVVRLRVDGEPLTLINVHFKSKSDGEELTRPRRVAQARYVGAVVAQLRAAAPDGEVIVLGDLNDDEASAALAALISESGMESLWQTLPPEARYAYIFEGAAQVLDHILVTPGLAERLVTFAPIHLNADFPHALHLDPTSFYRTSDHDPLIIVVRSP